MTNDAHADDERAQVHTVLLYSPKEERRRTVRTAIGRRPAKDVGRIEWIECLTYDEVIENVDRGGVDLAILDGEAQPTGGMGLSRQMKYELDDCPAVLVVIAREADRWLATWSLADATLLYPVDPLTAGEVVAQQLRNRTAGVPVLR
ncbi:hypothetical protein [Cumulibacter manganitolerans]|uniref:hypothetical protein n=1 Tax=Cumulibacter manganitolerans TaxID=1884992 RepID=UPI001297DABD|nr:hypothetical protein [Cumulibacter manganitolerans]